MRTAEPDVIVIPEDAPEVRAPRMDLLDGLFLLGALIAPMELAIFGSFTVYDFLLAGLLFAIAVGPRRLRRLPAAFRWVAILFLAFALASSFRATFPAESLTQAAQFAFIFFVQIPVVLTLGHTGSIIRWSLVLFVVGSLGAVVVSILTGHATGADRVLLFNSTNPNPLGYPGAYILPFVVWRLSDLWRARRRMLFLVVAVVTLGLIGWSLAASASRGATVAALVGLPVFLVLRKATRLGAATLVWLVVALALVLAIGYAFYETSYFPPILKDRIDRTLKNDSTLIKDRERLAVAGMREFESSPFIGTGLDNFRYVSSQYEEAATPQAPHNMWIQFLAQVGIVGAAAMAVIIVRWFLIMFRAWREDSDASRHELLAAFIASMAAIMTIYMTTPIMVDRHYWLLFGLGLAVAALPSRPGREAVLQ
jgi:O-Antigen ligase